MHLEWHEVGSRGGRQGGGVLFVSRGWLWARLASRKKGGQVVESGKGDLDDLRGFYEAMVRMAAEAHSMNAAVCLTVEEGQEVGQGGKGMEEDCDEHWMEGAPLVEEERDGLALVGLCAEAVVRAARAREWAISHGFHRLALLREVNLAAPFPLPLPPFPARASSPSPALRLSPWVLLCCADCSVLARRASGFPLVLSCESTSSCQRLTMRQLTCNPCPFLGGQQMAHHADHAA